MQGLNFLNINYSLRSWPKNKSRPDSMVDFQQQNALFTNLKSLCFPQCLYWKQTQENLRTKIDCMNFKIHLKSPWFLISNFLSTLGLICCFEDCRTVSRLCSCCKDPIPGWLVDCLQTSTTFVQFCDLNLNFSDEFKS